VGRDAESYKSPRDTVRAEVLMNGRVVLTTLVIAGAAFAEEKPTTINPQVQKDIAAAATLVQKAKATFQASKPGQKVRVVASTISAQYSKYQASLDGLDNATLMSPTQSQQCTDATIDVRRGLALTDEYFVEECRAYNYGIRIGHAQELVKEKCLIAVRPIPDFMQAKCDRARTLFDKTRDKFQPMVDAANAKAKTLYADALKEYQTAQKLCPDYFGNAVDVFYNNVAFGGCG
jgi:hypothetical protein